MSDTCPVVRIAALATADNPEGFVEINAADFDPAVHTLLGQMMPASVPAAAETDLKPRRKKG